MSLIRKHPECSVTILRSDVTQVQGTCSIMELNPLETSGFFLSDYSRTLKTISTLLKQKSVE